MLPIESKLIHCRWTGESTWIPFGDFRPGLDYENHTSHPAPGQLAIYPGGISECEIFFPYGGCTTASKVGRWRPTTSPRRRRRGLGGPPARDRPALPVGRRPVDLDPRGRRLTRRPHALTDLAHPRRDRRHRRRLAAGADVGSSTADASMAVEPDLASSAPRRGSAGRGHRCDRAAGAPRRGRRPHPHAGRDRRRARPLLPGLGRGGVRRDDDVPRRSTTRARARRRPPSARSWPGSREWRAATEADSAIDYGLSLAISGRWTTRRRAAGDGRRRRRRPRRRSWSSTSGSPTERLFEAMRVMGERGGMLQVHCEDPVLIDAAVADALARGDIGPRFHATTRPTEAEAVATAPRDGLRPRGDAPVHVVHLSSAAALDDVRRAKAAGVRATAETCPHYLPSPTSEYERARPGPLRRGACTAGGIQTFRHSRYFRQRAKCWRQASPTMGWASSPTPSSRPEPPEGRRSGGTYFVAASAKQVPRRRRPSGGFARDDGKRCVMASRRGRERHARRMM